MNEYSRITKIISDDKFNKIRNLRVLIVGIGGVGASALEMLVRTGVNNIIIVDYDTFEESNLNRQILSLRSNLNESKVEVAKTRILDINPNCNVTIINDKLSVKILNDINYNVDYIIDACDDVKAKIEMVKYALRNNIKIISSCGMGNRIKPDKLEITNIWKTKNDPLAKKVRHELKKEKISYKLPVVCSNELPLLKTNESVGSIATVPNAAGILLASYVINNVLMDD